jgi:O-antigen/teichoic acid export membrane protein
MSAIRGTLKNLGAALTSNVISILTELVVPVLFLHRYGNAMYGAWIVLTTAVAYLGNLNFGVQTYVNQDLAVRFARGERESFHVQQSTALRILLCIGAAAALISATVFILPVERWLRLPLSHLATAFSLFFIALQVILQDILFGFFGGNYMVVGKAHRGANWNNAQRFSSACLLVVLVVLHLPLPMLAGAQTALFFGFLGALLLDIRRTAPEIFPTLRYWDKAAVRSILSNSGYFGLIVWSSFFCYQLPIILLQRLAGAYVVVAFTLMRKIFGLGRQVLNGLTQSMGPEITRIYGEGDWPALTRVFTASEKVVFAGISLVNLPLYFWSPLLLALWIHRPGYFSPFPYLLIACVNTVLCVKEHKFQFQFSTNTHERLAKVMFFGYLAMSAVSLVMIRRFGLNGFLLTWLVTEIVQTAAIMEMNQKLFVGQQRLTHTLLRRLVLECAAGFGIGYFGVRQTLAWSLAGRLGVDILLTAILIGVSYGLFGLGELRSLAMTKLSRMRGSA